MGAVWVSKMKTERHLVESREVSTSRVLPVQLNTNIMNTGRAKASEDGKTLN